MNRKKSIKTAVLPPAPCGPDRMDRLVERIAERDPMALAELHHTLRPHIFATVSAVLHDLDQIRAVVAATFLEVWNMAPVTRPDPAGAAHWISTIAMHRATERVVADMAADTALRDFAIVHDQNYRLELQHRVGPTSIHPR